MTREIVQYFLTLQRAAQVFGVLCVPYAGNPKSRFWSDWVIQWFPITKFSFPWTEMDLPVVRVLPKTFSKQSCCGRSQISMLVYNDVPLCASIRHKSSCDPASLRWSRMRLGKEVGFLLSSMNKLSGVFPSCYLAPSQLASFSPLPLPSLPSWDIDSYNPPMAWLVFSHLGPAVFCMSLGRVRPCPRPAIEFLTLHCDSSSGARSTDSLPSFITITLKWTWVLILYAYRTSLMVFIVVCSPL